MTHTSSGLRTARRFQLPVPAGAHGPTATRTPTVEIVVPVYNEERALPGCVRTLHARLRDELPYPWRITVADNASVDRTLAVAEELADALPGVGVVHMERKGRGLALRTVWGASDADIVVYMDVDLSTGLDGLLPLIAPLASGHSDLAIGSRLAPGARTVRGPRRELISRCYNALIRHTHGARFSDAQCGFKAARTDVLRPLLAKTQDDAWFFDTELLLLAEHNGLRIHEVPVDWVEDVDTRVDVVTLSPLDEQAKGAELDVVETVGDPDRLLQVVTNLLSNALVHTPPGTPVDARVGTARAGAETGGTDRPGRTSASPPLPEGTPVCVIAVVDRGPGLPPQEAERVFERFYRVDPSRSRDHGGSGLGLAIATAIAQGHGGRLELDTGPGEGCTFRLVLPLGDAARPA
ncbi:ATP-binding protein [Streptomyces sp. NPDC050997]|uniref:ATP-binding protein n=1 Tax=Streptomyces sp. NPDC050997 TaxID=3155519 RepID=UPI0034435285